jgi:hypothetical protein
MRGAAPALARHDCDLDHAGKHHAGRRRPDPECCAAARPGGRSASLDQIARALTSYMGGD